MPYKYVIEMFCDFIGAGMAYEKTKWTTKSPLTYYLTKCKGQRLMHRNSEKLLVDLLTNLSQVSSVNEFIKWYKKHKTDLKNNY
jgi:hypothetical protein